MLPSSPHPVRSKETHDHKPTLIDLEQTLKQHHTSPVLAGGSVQLETDPLYSEIHDKTKLTRVQNPSETRLPV